jgi:hypothetical protein
MIDKVSDAHRGVNCLRDVREQVLNWQKRLAGHEAIAKASEEIVKKLNAVEDELILPGDQKDTYSLVHRPRLNAALASLISAVNSADARPTQQARELAALYGEQIDAQLAKLEETIQTDVAELNRLIQQAGAPPVVVK